MGGHQLSEGLLSLHDPMMLYILIFMEPDWDLTIYRLLLSSYDNNSITFMIATKQMFSKHCKWLPDVVNEINIFFATETDHKSRALAWLRLAAAAC